MLPEVSDIEESAPAGLTVKRVKNAVEAALVCSGRPIPLEQLVLMFNEAVGLDTVRFVLDELVEEYQNKGVEILCLQEGWTVRGRPEYSERVGRTQPGKAPKYSSAVLQVLAVIAYRQPVTRGDIEEVRGVAVSSSILHQLEERGWIETIGHRSAPGNPALWATTGKFLDDLKLSSLDELPSIDLPSAPAHASVLTPEAAQLQQLTLEGPLQEAEMAQARPAERTPVEVDLAGTDLDEASQASRSLVD